MSISKEHRLYYIFAALFFYSLIGYSQVDSTKSDLVIKQGPIGLADDGQIYVGADLSQKDPSKAALYSAILPGLGQMYNGKFWKLPLVYGAIGAGIYGVTWNQKNYNIFLEAYRIRKNGGIDDYINILRTEEQLISWMDYYRNNRDLSIIITIGLYALNILDAYVDAHLINFTITDDISLKIEPSVMPSNNFNYMYAYGLKLSFDF